MALVRPTLLAIPAFDSSQPFSFQFIADESGAQITGNILKIRNNATNVVVYNETQTTFRYEHTLPANTLENGVNYNATITTIDAQGNQSPESVPIQFWCYTQPVVVITNIPATGLINNPSFEFNFTYNQAEDERINSYEVNLYNVSNQLMASSGVQYAIYGAPPFTSSYLLAGFANLTEYKVEVVCVTINNTVVSSGLIPFTVRYVVPNVYSLVSLTENCSGGYITLQSNLLSIEGTSEPTPPIYIDEREVDLRGIGDYAEWTQGYTINGDMLTRVWFRDPNSNTQILTFTNVAGDTITVEYREGYVDDDDTTTKLAYIILTVDSARGAQYFIYSDYIPILNSLEYYNLWIRRVNNIYQLEFSAL